MIDTVEKPILGLDIEFPDEIFVLSTLISNNKKYACYCYRGVHGLLGFSKKELAETYSENLLDGVALSVESVNFDEAREIAKARPAPVTALLLVDIKKEPMIHYVK